MNIIYLLTNSNRKAGEKRFYIGAKAECRVEIINNISTIIDIKTEKPYLGSATDFNMKEDIINGHIFQASILQTVGNKKDILEVENKEIIKYNAVESNEYYNYAYAVIGGFSYNHDAIINSFGEIKRKHNASKSGISKKNNTAKKFGFDSLSKFAIWIYNEFLICKNYAIIAEKLKCKRHIPRSFIENFNMEKHIKEIEIYNENLKTKIRDLYIKGASFDKIKEILSIEIPTICYYMDNFKKKHEREYLTASRKGLTEEELKIKILKLFLEGNSVKEAAKILQINAYSANRYFYKSIRERLKINEL